ncbi:MAG TPA: FKBP-type peptidyl-prolyl cis-trans isomerase [Holophaga sp.]|nr:FKBP-type peptidyl-prolyl cis-trans isomerase [Holophaga sp.]
MHPLLPALILTLAAPGERFPVPPAPAELQAPPAAVREANGLATQVLRPGKEGKKPGADDMVTVEYVAWTQEGKLIDTTARRDRPFACPIDQLMKGMAQGLRLMTPGEKRRLWIPQVLAFEGAPNRPAGTVIVDLELLAVEPSPFQAPPDLAVPAEDARLLKGGVLYKTLREGEGKPQPGAKAQVSVRYSGWTADGKCFDSSWRKGSRPASLRVDEVIPGWTQVLRLMSPGQKVRTWIPVGQAYDGQKGMPAGALVFDIELLSIDTER